MKAASNNEKDGFYLTEIKGDRAIIHIKGPMLHRNDWFTQWLGLFTYESFISDLQKLASSQSTRCIVLNVDSGGGSASGIWEAAEALREIKASMEVTAYVSGSCCSAAYWLASQASKIIAAPTALIGSIGVMTTVRKRKDSDTIEFVSSQSPLKNASPESQEGKISLQRTIDDLCSVFIADVAQGRGVSDDKVKDDFGRGDVFIGEKALKMGLIDELGKFPEAKEGIIIMDAKELLAKYPEACHELLAGEKTKEKERVASIMELSSYCKDQNLLLKLVANHEMTADKAAIEILKASQNSPEETAKENKGEEFLAKLAAAEKTTSKVASCNTPASTASKEDVLSDYDKARAAVRSLKGGK